MAKSINTTWTTAAMKSLLMKSDRNIKVVGQGGDHDSEGLILSAKGAKRGYRLFITGFHCQAEVKTPENCQIEMIEVSDGEDSAGGLNTADRATALMYADVCCTLRDAGYIVVPSMDDYF